MTEPVPSRERPSAPRVPPAGKDRPSARRVEPASKERPSAARVPPVAKDRPSATRVEPVERARPSSKRLEPVPKARPSAARVEPAARERPSATRVQPAARDRPSATRVEPAPAARPSSRRLQPASSGRTSAARVEAAPPGRRSSVTTRSVVPPAAKSERQPAVGRPAPPRTGLYVGLGVAVPLLLALFWFAGRARPEARARPDAPAAPTTAATPTKPAAAEPASAPAPADAPPSAPAVAAAKPAEPQPNAKPAAPEGTAKPPEDFAKNLKDAEAQVKTGKYSGPLKLLDDLKTQHGQAPWWAEEEKNWTRLRTFLDQQYKEYKEEAQEVREGLRKDATTGSLNTVEAAWKPRAESGDELAAQPAREILDNIARIRLKQADEARAKRAEQIVQKLDEYEKLLKARTPGKTLDAKVLEPVFRLLEESEPQVTKNLEVATSLAERLAALRFDAQLARDGDLSMLGGQVKAAGGPTEITFDFSTAEQFRAWAWDRPGGANAESAPEYDQAKGAVVIRSSGDHSWDGPHRKDLGVLRLPFAFRPDAWVFEADVAEISHADPRAPPDMGILVWDGSANILRLGLREGPTQANSKEKQTLIYAAGCLQKQTSYSKDVGRLPCGVTETVRLTLASRGGLVSFGAVVQGKGAAPITASVALPFLPKWVGLYLRTRTKEDAASAAFDNVKLTVAPDPEALKALAATRRDGLVAKARAEVAARTELTREVLESVTGNLADWDRNWSYEGRNDKDAHLKLDYRGRTGVWRTCPAGLDKPARWYRRVKLDPDTSYTLHLEVTSHDNSRDWQLVVRANGKELLTRSIRTSSWESFDVDLSAFAGQEVLLELVQKAAGALLDNYGYWDRVCLRRK